MATQSNSTFRSILDTLTLPLKSSAAQVKSLVQPHKVLTKLFGMDTNKGASGIPTFEGRYIKMPINALYPVTYSQISDFNIQHGDVKQQKSGKNVIYAELAAVDKGWTMGITTYDLQLLKNKGVDATIDWIKGYWTDTNYAFGLSLLNSIYSGVGDDATNSNGETKPDFYGLSTAIGTGTYAGKTTTDWYEWQSQAIDWTSTVFGETTVTTIAAATTVATGSLQTPFYNVLMHSIEKCKQFSKSKKYLVVMHPAVYNFCFLGSLEVNVKSSKIITPNSTSIVEVDRYAQYDINGATIMPEYASIPTAEQGSAPTYLFPANKIYIIDMDSIFLMAEKSNNFVVSDWQEIPNQYNTLQKSMTTTLLFGLNKRFSSGVITLNSTLASACTSAFGI